MSFLFTPSDYTRQAHVKHSPSLTLERGETRLRPSRIGNQNERTSFYLNTDTGIDLDGELKSGYVSGDLRSITPSPDSASTSFEPMLRAASLDPRSSVHRRSSSSLVPPFDGQPHFRPISRSSSAAGLIQRQREEREIVRRQTMRRAGGNVYCGTIGALLSLMTVCLTVIILIYLKLR
ncbi:hypothetical protein PIIN_09703 [Serendipita indica DSM 11827]|uniref:Uncharacterized protein n=1 Tax=Serendipita indica (strain DSM 11827) TaxID=1109443 RepID=G4TWM0_SERID|nr:hypothetical protein PIIN_09703 [Serendipita indica DSM 11827]